MSLAVLHVDQLERVHRLDDGDQHQLHHLLPHRPILPQRFHLQHQSGTIFNDFQNV